ncbi:MAG: hypothetical protein ACT4P7_10410 [Gemmatimonadaceae bacterium]
MFRRHTLLVASMVAMVACGESPTYPALPYNGGTPAPQVELVGTIEVESGFDQPEIRLVQASGERTLLIGSEAQRLIQLAGADVLVRGGWVGTGLPEVEAQALMYWDSAMGLNVSEFVVLAVDGRAAMDGVVIEADGHFALRLSDGTIHTFDDGVMDLAAYVGARIWVTGSMEDPPLALGVIRYRVDGRSIGKRTRRPVARPGFRVAGPLSTTCDQLNGGGGGGMWFGPVLQAFTNALTRSAHSVH